jgi:Domain of unknown function (DUF4174)
MKYVAPVIVFTSSMIFAQDKISDFQWQSRLLVVSGATQGIVELLESDEAGFEERDLKVFILSGEGLPEYAARPSLAKELESRLSPAKSKPMVYLIGKDGKTTLRWSLEEFTIAKLFASIDAMPMRKSEMRDAE